VPVNLDLSKIDFEQYTVNVGGALTIMIVGWLIAGWAGSLVKSTVSKSDRISPTLIPLFAKLARLAVLSVVILAALHRIGVETSGVFAMLGAAGLAVGLALKDTVADIAAGIILLILRPFDVGDAVNIGANGGVVQAIDIFQTRLTSFDGVPIVINNSAVRTAVIQNFTRAQNRRIELNIGIGYEDDLGKAISTISAVLQAEPRLLETPAYVVKAKSLGENAVVVLARCTTKASDFESTMFDLNRAIKERLDEAGITLPAQRPMQLTQVGPTPAKPA
jgi:small conductance mechanosensitive channel